MQHVYLGKAEGGARTGDHVLDAGLVHGDDVGLTLDEIDAVELGDSLLGLVDAVEQTGFVVNLGVGRVDILLLNALGTLVKHTGGKADNLAAESNPRENDSAGVSVDEVATVGLVADAGLEEELCLIAFALGTTGERKAVLQVVAQTELGDDVVAETTRPKVLQSYSLTIGVFVQ